MMQRPAWFFVCVILGLGCGGSGSVELDDFAAEFSAATCEKLFACCTDAELMARFELLGPEVDTVDECNDFYAGLTQALLVPTIRAGVDEGRLIYHSDRAGQCLDVLAGMTCAEFAAVQSSDSFSGCESPFEPLVEIGGTCFSDDECISGYCEDNGDSGTCAELPDEGEACAFECADGLQCAFDSDAGESVCQPLLAGGSACDFDDECASGNCAGGDPQMGTPGTCSSAMTCDGI